jgi:hypothetical protein
MVFSVPSVLTRVNSVLLRCGDGSMARPKSSSLQVSTRQLSPWILWLSWLEILFRVLRAGVARLMLG